MPMRIARRAADGGAGGREADPLVGRSTSSARAARGVDELQAVRMRPCVSFSDSSRVPMASPLDAQRP